MKKIIIFLLFIAVVFLSPESAIWAKDFTIAVVKKEKVQIYESALVGFRKTLTDSGYVEGKNITIDLHNLEDKNAIRLMKNKNYDLVYAIGTESVLAVKKEIPAVPIVFSMVLNPVENNIVKTMHASGTNITGATLNMPAQLQMNLIKKLLPTVKKVGVLYNPINSRAIIEQSRQDETLQLVAVKVNADIEVPNALKNLSGQIDMLWLPPDLVYTRDSLAFVLKYCLENKIAVMGFAPYLAKAGALFCYAYDFVDVGQQAGELALKVFAGESAGKLPLTVPRKVTFVLNLGVAKILNINIPNSIRNEAAEIYQ